MLVYDILKCNLFPLYETLTNKLSQGVFKDERAA